MDPPQASMPSTVPIKPTTTDEIAEECPRFRILIVGRPGVGKSSLINAIFKISLADVRHFEAGTAKINEGITSPHNKHLVIHNSEGYEPGDEEKFRILEKFITERSQKETIGQRLHAIWLCVMTPYHGGTIVQAWDEKIFRLSQRKVPIIVVYTKFDLFMAYNRRKGKGNTGKGDGSLESAEKHFYEKYSQLFAISTKNIEGQISHTIVSQFQPETLLRLVEITRQNVRAESMNISNGLSPGSVEDFLDATQINFATAPRDDTSDKIDASIKVGKKQYWRAIASGIHFLNFSLKKCLDVMHKDLVGIWNIRDMEGFFLSDAFSRQMLIFVGELSNQDQGSDSPMGTMAPAVLANLSASSVYKGWPEHVRCLMGYVVDLTLILQAVFLDSLQDRCEGRVSLDRVKEIIYEFYFSEKKKRIHNAIRNFQPSFTKGDVMDKIESLLKENEMTKMDTQFDLNRPVLPSLLRILRFELNANGLIVNRIILELTRKLFDSLSDSPDYVRPDYGTILESELDNPSDIGVLLDFILNLLLNGNLSESGIPAANRRARRLIFKLISTTNVIPRSLFITGVKREMDSGAVGSGGFGSVFKGEYGGRLVALKLLNKVCHQSSVRNDFLREAVAWRSLSHCFILPFWGIYEEKPSAFLVSPFMTNGTLSEWRKKQTQAVAEIHRLMLEVAEGVQYLHSDGIIHGDLHGGNVLLDSDFHCQITDFGLTRHSDATVAWSTKTFIPNFAAPELFGICAKCNQPSCSGCYEGHNGQHRKKTMNTDVYAFGCLYYAIYFDALPYEGKGAYEIVLLVGRGERPIRLESPRMDGHTWDLIRNCLEFIPPNRPTMEQIVETMADATPLLPTLLAILRVELPARNAINPITLDLMRKLLKPHNYHTIAYEPNTDSDIELLLDFILCLLRDGSLVNDDIPDANRRARRLLGKLSEKDILPRSLFITDVKTDSTVIGMGGFGNVSMGSYEGQFVALKVLYRTSHQEDSLRRVFCREALAWRSLSHKFILPLLGIYEEKAWLFLVSPLMVNGTLSEWRRNQETGIIEIHRLIQEVAEGVQYIHSEGIVHGDLHPGNILLDDNFHCKITDFGLTRDSEATITDFGSTRHSKATVARSTTTYYMVYFAAPELFGTCANCGRGESAGCFDGREHPHRNRTLKTDIYAFGCLYYAIFFDTVPFQGKTDYQITRLVTAGMRPDRLENPEMEGDTWNLIQSCWKSLPLERPTMEQIVQMLPHPA